MRQALRLFFALFLTASLQAKEKPWAMLFADASDDGVVRLYWSLRDWPVDLKGFNLKRKDVDQSSTNWQKLNRSLLIPSSNKDKDFANQGLSAERVIDIQKAYTELDRNGEVNPISGEDMVNLLKSIGGPLAGDRIAMSSNFNIALIYGFAFVDEKADVNGRYSYGLFTVSDDGSESLQPVAEFVYEPRLNTDEPYMVELQASAGSGIELTWDMEQARSDALSIVGFKIYRRAISGDSEWQALLTSGAFSTGDIRGGIMYYKFNDRKANLKLEYEYGVAPINMFQRECALSTTLYVPEVPVEAIPVEIASVRQSADCEVELTWEVPIEYAEAYASLTVLRVDSITSDYVAVSPALANSATTYIDRSFEAKKEKHQYYYKLMATTRSGEKLYSKVRSMFLKPLPQPVEGLTGEVILKDEVPHVRLMWDAAKDGITEAYTLASDRRFGKMLKNGSIGKITANEVEVSLKGDAGGHALHFQIIPLTASGDEGQPAELAVYLPLLKFPDISEFDADLRYNMDGAMLRWDYPSFKDLEGFRLYMNDELIADETQLLANARGWVVNDYQVREGKRTAAFSLEAIGAYATSRAKVTYFSGDTDRDYSIPPVRRFNAEQLKSESGEYENRVRLSWRLPDEAVLAKLVGFRIYSDMNKEYGDFAFDPARSHSIDTTEFIVELPEGDRRNFQFRLVPMTIDKDKGQYHDVKFYRKAVRASAPAL